MNYSELEDIYIQFQKIEKDYYSLRYKYWNTINQIKKQSPHKMSYKQFEGQCRRLTKKIRSKIINTKPKGKYELDHRTSLLEAYYLGWSIDKACDISNLEWIPKKDNRSKGILSFKRFQDINKDMENT